MDSTEPEADDKRLWTFLVSRHLRFLIEWINSYHRAYGHGPDTMDITKERLLSLPEEISGRIEVPDRRGSYAFSPFKKPTNVTNRKSYGTMMTQGSQVVNKRNVKVSITDYPKFSGQAKDWVTFERKFRSVASSQGFDYILKEEEFDPDDDIEKKQYQEDSSFIYDAFQNSWADSMNFYLVEQNKKNKDGRKVYLDAKNYFRGAAVKDAILMENMDTLINYKLTHTTPNGAEGYNNKFNDIVNSLEQQGHVLEPTVLKGIFLGNMKDKVYEQLKDQLQHLRQQH